MNKNYGQIYREIRKSKGISQMEICSTEFSRSALSKIENGKTTPNFDNMIFLLEQINMTFDEFNYICNHFQQPTPHLKFLTKENFSSPIIKKLAEIQMLNSGVHSSVHNICMELDFCHSIKNIHTEEFMILKNESQKIWSYLERQDTWYLSDLALFTSILSFFPVDNILLFSNEIIKRINKYTDFSCINPLKKIFLVKLSTIYLHNELKEECGKITQLIINLARSTKQYDTLGFAQVRLGLCLNDSNLIEQGLNLLYLTNEIVLIKKLKSEIKKYR